MLLIVIFPILPISHSDDDAPLFGSGFDVAVRLGNLLQWVAPIDDRAQLSRLDQLF